MKSLRCRRRRYGGKISRRCYRLAAAPRQNVTTSQTTQLDHTERSSRLNHHCSNVILSIQPKTHRPAIEALDDRMARMPLVFCVVRYVRKTLNQTIQRGSRFLFCPCQNELVCSYSCPVRSERKAWRRTWVICFQSRNFIELSLFSATRVRYSPLER